MAVPNECANQYLLRATTIAGSHVQALAMHADVNALIQLHPHHPTSTTFLNARAKRHAPHAQSVVDERASTVTQYACH